MSIQASLSTNAEKPSGNPVPATAFRIESDADSANDELLTDPITGDPFPPSPEDVEFVESLKVLPPGIFTVQASNRMATIPEDFRWVLSPPEKLQAILVEGSADGDHRAKERIQLLQKLEKRLVRRLPEVLPERIRQVQALEDRFPHFKVLIDLIVPTLIRQMVAGRPLRLPPFLLLGDPGLGKTYFVGQLAQVLGLYFQDWSLAEMSGANVLRGTHRSWGGSTVGGIARTLIDVPMLQAPLILFDELDKVRGDPNVPVMPTLLGLLESHTAARFRDEFLDVPLDLRPVSFLFTANAAPAADSPLGSRLRVVTIPKPTREQMGRIIRTMDAGLRSADPSLEQYVKPLSDEVVALMSTHSPRVAKRLLEEAYDRLFARSLETLLKRQQARLELLASDLVGITVNDETYSLESRAPMFVRPVGGRLPRFGL